MVGSIFYSGGVFLCCSVPLFFVGSCLFVCFVNHGKLASKDFWQKYAVFEILNY